VEERSFLFSIDSALFNGSFAVGKRVKEYSELDRLVFVLGVVGE